LTVKIEDKQYTYKPFEFFSEGFKTIPFNEVLAYKLSIYWGLNVIPFTGINDIEPFGKGSFQTFIDNAAPMNLYEGTYDQKSATELFILDTLFGNTNRKDDNILVDADGRFYGTNNAFVLGFHSFIEMKKRDKDYYWNLNLYSTSESAYLALPDKFVSLIEPQYLTALINKIQETPFLYQPRGYMEFDDEAIWKEVREALVWRIKNLPALVWEQTKHIGG
jgi:hypothetical protein